MFNRIRMGVRPSPLAIKQAREVERLLAGLAHFEIRLIPTQGDEDKVTPLSRFEGGDFFTRQIEDELLEGRIDAAVHSAKDLEEEIPGALVIAALTRCLSPYECLVSRSGRGLLELPRGAVVGTSSRKRRGSVLKCRPDLFVKDIRGNIDERLEQMDRGHFDAVVVAHVALIRLGLEHRVTQIIPLDVMEPHPLQGRLAVQIRRDRKELFDFFRRIHEE